MINVNKCILLIFLFNFNGRELIFTSGNLAGQSASISDYAGATKALTVTSLTEARANGDNFIIV